MGDDYKYEPDQAWEPVVATKRILMRIMDHASFADLLGARAWPRPGFGFCWAIKMLIQNEFDCDSSPVCGNLEWTASALGLLDGTKCNEDNLSTVQGRFIDFIEGPRDVRGNVKAYEESGLMRVDFKPIPVW